MNHKGKRIKTLTSEIDSEIGSDKDCVVLVSDNDGGVMSYSPLSPAAVNGILHSYLDD